MPFFPDRVKPGSLVDYLNDECFWFVSVSLFSVPFDGFSSIFLLQDKGGGHVSSPRKVGADVAVDEGVLVNFSIGYGFRR